MKILKAKVNWMFGWNNSPNLEILVDKIPNMNMARHEFKDGLWYAEQDGFVHFLSHPGDGTNQGGYYGDAIYINDKDGLPIQLDGPWSSRAGVVNKLFPHCVEVSLTDEPEAFEKGYTFLAGAITMKKAQEVVKMIGNIVMFREIDGYREIIYQIRREDTFYPCPTCKGFKQFVPLFPKEGITNKKKECETCYGTGTDELTVLRRRLPNTLGIWGVRKNSIIIRRPDKENFDENQQEAIEGFCGISLSPHTTYFKINLETVKALVDEEREQEEQERYDLDILEAEADAIAKEQAEAEEKSRLEQEEKAKYEAGY